MMPSHKSSPARKGETVNGVSLPARQFPTSLLNEMFWNLYGGYQFSSWQSTTRSLESLWLEFAFRARFVHGKTKFCTGFASREEHPSLNWTRKESSREACTRTRLHLHRAALCLQRPQHILTQTTAHLGKKANLTNMLYFWTVRVHVPSSHPL